MEKPTFKRMGLGMLQHISLALVVMIIVMIAQKSVICAENMYGDIRRYRLELFDDAKQFEDTVVFADMFDNAVSDLTTLVVIKGQLEVNGVYDGEKQIDVTAFVNRKELVSSCPITAVYYLDDLIKWGKNGVEMVSRTFTKKEFVNYFWDDLTGIQHFYLDEETGALRYQGELTEDGGEDSDGEASDGQETDETGEGTSQDADILQAQLERLRQEEKEQQLREVYNNYLQYNEDQLTDMAYSYLASHMDKPVTLSMNDSGQETVHIDMLNPRYATVDGDGQLTGIADNWLDYCKLENNIVDTIESLAYNYSLYDSWNDIYTRGNTNLSYLVRVPRGESYVDYTNLAPEYLSEYVGDIDNFFEDIGKYITYSVDDIECVGNVDISDDQMFNIVETHKYAYPEGTRMWIGVDTNFPIRGDQFETGRDTYNSLIPRIGEYILLIGVCLIVWLGLFGYLTYTAGRAVDEEGNIIWYLNGFDRLYTEFVLAIGCVLAYFGASGFYRVLMTAWDGDNYLIDQKLLGNGKLAQWYLAGLGALLGFAASLAFCILWYSLARRLRSRNIWRDSFLHGLWQKCCRGASMVLYHRSTTIRTLIPYNLFLIVNLCCLVGIYVYQGYKYPAIAIALFLLVFDAMVGVVIFRRNAELADIVDAIKRIRRGESDYQLEVERLHGENREIAEAVNNIGEGIENAVAISVKDERMKSDLITNVSHDIKTPLTSIINYVDLLKRQKIETEPVKSYIEILDSKSQRLKQLTDDLVEASKISSGNIELQRERLNLTELLNQSVGEFSEKFEEKQLQLVFEHADCQADIYADSSRMWRVIENLFNNIFKYAMPVTRVYIDVQVEDGMVEASVKNISQKQLNIRPDELTERFIRGDVSRSTEGSGLGLSIAKSLVEVQGGEFDVYLDGDLFKVTIRFPEYAQEEEEQQAKEQNTQVEEAQQP